MAGKPLPKTQSSMRAKSNAKASKKRSMFNLFMVARPFSLPPPADVTSGNKETDEDNDEALRVIIRWTKQKKRKHRLAAVVGRLESEWSFIRQIEISLPFFDRLGIDSTIIVTDCGGLAGNKYTSLRFLFHILIKKCTAVSAYRDISPYQIWIRRLFPRIADMLHRGSGGGWMSFVRLWWGAPRPTPQPLRRAKSKAKASKMQSMSDLFVAAPTFTLPPPANVTSGNEATDEDDDKVLSMIIWPTKKNKRKHRLAKPVGRPESEWSFIRECAGTKLVIACLGVHPRLNNSPPLSLAPVSPPPPPPPLPPLRCHPFASSPSPPPRLSASAASPSTPSLHRVPSVASPPLPPLRHLPASLPPLPPLRRLPFNSSPPPPPLHRLRFAASPPPPALHRLPFLKAVKTDAAAAATSTPKFYSADDVKPRQPSTRKPNATKLRSSIMPGTVLILLTGRFMGKRVVFLKQLKSGLLLLTGPFKINGVPIRRVNQAYVITTSTKVDVFGINVPEALFLLYHKHDVPVKWVCRELEGQRPFGAEDMQPLEAPRFMWWADELAAAVAVGSSRPMPSRTVKAKAPKNRSMSYLFMVAPSLTLPPPTDQSG
ncbi:hypothetical protein GUJ93_ZPchr0278g22893 [Zizania palustris]|uniref:60S ribosomal protein L6 n=1 Tax=Zizania palustris TaxID=103762 RepID=A0A8J5RBU9_ZIZPA|nr:hypothetical protein GUJ93_ZPchr0278g22893 [Zizania palustris]